MPKDVTLARRIRGEEEWRGLASDREKAGSGFHDDRCARPRDYWNPRTGKPYRKETGPMPDFWKPKPRKGRKK